MFYENSPMLAKQRTARLASRSYVNNNKKRP